MWFWCVCKYVLRHVDLVRARAECLWGVLWACGRDDKCNSSTVWPHAHLRQRRRVNANCRTEHRAVVLRSTCEGERVDVAHP
jgi:hypothetical protein